MRFQNIAISSISSLEGEVAIILGNTITETTLDDDLSALVARLQANDLIKDNGAWLEITAPAGMKATRLWIAKNAEDMREQGAKLAAVAKGEVTLFGADTLHVFGFGLRNYAFDKHQSEQKTLPSLVISSNNENAEQDFAPYAAQIDGVHLTRTLVNEPANVLTTTEFANRIEALRDLGVDVEILEEDQLEALGMRALLGVGQGSRSPSKVATMKWMKGKGDPLLLVGKGVVFDTGGISLKPAAGMEAMTMDMGGAGTVVGTMHAIAKRKAKANVVGIVGLVENMPDGNAQRPGDIVTSMKGDTIEVINTDAEGRLVLADILWHGQQEFKPRAVIDLATLTGAMLVALGQEMAGAFSNDDAFVDQFLTAAETSGEGVWRMPIGKNYAKMIEGTKGDIVNSAGRYAGSITAAEFLHRFIQDDMPWIHLDIAGVAAPDKPTPLAPKGASGWGVMALNQLVIDQFETN